MKRNKQSKVVDVDKGLVIVRYATAADESVRRKSKCW
jgi:hypothetical protein